MAKVEYDFFLEEKERRLCECVHIYIVTIIFPR